MKHFRYLNNEGRDQWRDWLEKLKQDTSLDVPAHLLEDSRYSESPQTQVPLPSGGWATKLDMADALIPLVEALENEGFAAEVWYGVWDALAIQYFDDICPKLASGDRKVGEIERFHYDPRYSRYYKHRTAANIFFRRSFGAAARLFLYAAPKFCSDFEIRIGSYKSWLGAPAVGMAAYRLFWDADRSAHLRGSMNMDKPGLLGHFINVVSHLERTYDLAGTDSEAMLSLMPECFKIRNAQADVKG